jgi:membrane protein YdbS with pleckstrin-like domain
MAEEPVWQGTSSQLKNFWFYVSCILLLPIPRTIWAWLEVRCRVYTLTTERLLIESGVFSKVQDTLELYRVRDIQVTQSFIQRMFNLQNIHLISTDLTSQNIVLDYIPKVAGLSDQVRTLVEACRMRKGVRELGVDLDQGLSTS